MSVTTSAEFSALFFLVDGLIHELQVWDNQLEPMEFGKRPVKEWVTEHILGMVYTVRELIPELPKEGDFQILVRRGQICGYLTGWETEEWDEDMEFLEVEFAPIPDEYLRERFHREPFRPEEPTP